MVSYAAMTWAHRTEDESTEQALETLQRAAINTMVKIPRSTPNKGLEIILDIMPLHLHVRKEGLSAYLRLYGQAPMQWEGVFTNLTHSVSHRRFWEYMAADAHIQDFHTELDDCNVLRPPARYLLDTNSFVDMENCQEHLNCNVYTDGSKINGKVGAGVFILRDGQSVIEDKFRLPNSSTVYQAELTAIREAAAILGAFRGLTSVKFFVDSQAALRTLQSDFITSKLALQTITLLNSIPAERVVLVWTKAHVGNPGNDKADELAKSGTTLPHALAIPAPKASMKLSIREHFVRQWNEEWDKCGKGRQTKLYHPTLDVSKSNKLISWSRLKLGRYIRAVTGHSNLLYHLHTIDPSISPVCRFCLQANEEFHHLATDCPPLWWERHNISAQDPEHTHSWTVDQIITFAYIPAINTAFIRPLYPIDTPARQRPATTNPDDPDDPDPMDSDTEPPSDVSVMNVTSETESSSNNDEDIQVDSD